MMVCKLFHVKVKEKRIPSWADWVLDVVFIRSAEHKLIQMRRDGGKETREREREQDK